MDYISSRFCIYTYISLEKFDDEKLTEEFNNDFNLRQIWNKISIKTKEKKKKDSYGIFLEATWKTFIEILLTLPVEEPC